MIIIASILKWRYTAAQRILQLGQRLICSAALFKLCNLYKMNAICVGKYINFLAETKYQYLLKLTSIEEKITVQSFVKVISDNVVEEVDVSLAGVVQLNPEEDGGGDLERHLLQMRALSTCCWW